MNYDVAKAVRQVIEEVLTEVAGAPCGLAP